MSSGAGPDPRWLRRFGPAGAGVRLVCFPHAGGSASYFYPLAEALAPDADVLAAQYPGRQDRFSEPCLDTVDDLAEAVYRSLGDTARRPFVFFGHSMGSVVAFEVARRLEERTGRSPSRLFASGYPAPSRLPVGAVHRRDDAGVVRELRAIGGTDPAWLDDEDLRAVFLPAVRADYRAIENYTWVPGAPLSCPITTLIGSADPHTTTGSGSAWREHTAAEFDLRVFSGGHFFVDEHRPEIAGLIRSAVEQASESTTITGGTP
ncbi:alpha/beta fold hydrolase [Amycolatopsis sp. NBC_00355]|uniref:thioesterase II family protein n=1 Tax=Amycolatopsis sp. NBC_00355 TaxID=2975957 RepID=UPI002E2534D6